MEDRVDRLTVSQGAGKQVKKASAPMKAFRGRYGLVNQSDISRYSSGVKVKVGIYGHASGQYRYAKPWGRLTVIYNIVLCLGNLFGLFADGHDLR
jgi:hypothetical protein